MNLLTGFSDSPKQSTTFVLEDGSYAVIELEYRPNQLGWFYNLFYKDFNLYGQRLVTFPNILRQYKNQLPFGLAVATTNNTDPLEQNDFAAKTSFIVLLNAADVESIELSRFTRND